MLSTRPDLVPTLQKIDVRTGLPVRTQLTPTTCWLSIRVFAPPRAAAHGVNRGQVSAFFNPDGCFQRIEMSLRGRKRSSTPNGYDRPKAANAGAPENCSLADVPLSSAQEVSDRLASQRRRRDFPPDLQAQRSHPPEGSATDSAVRRARAAARALPPSSRARGRTRTDRRRGSS